MGSAPQGKQPLPISCSQGGDSRQAAGGQSLSPVHVPHFRSAKTWLSCDPSSAEPHGGRFCLAFCALTHQHSLCLRVLPLGATRDGSPASSSSLYPLPSCLGDPTAVLAASSWSRSAQAGWQV